MAKLGRMMPLVFGGLMTMATLLMVIQQITIFSLSDRIVFCTAYMGYWSDWGFIDDDGGYAILERQYPQPVPEPATMLLLGALVLLV